MIRLIFRFKYSCIGVTGCHTFTFIPLDLYLSLVTAIWDPIVLNYLVGVVVNTSIVCLSDRC